MKIEVTDHFVSGYGPAVDEVVKALNAEIGRLTAERDAVLTRVKRLEAALDDMVNLASMLSGHNHIDLELLGAARAALWGLR